MDKNSKGIPGRRDRELLEYAADLTAMIPRMQHDMHDHLLPRHVALVAIGKGESDPFGELRRGYAMDIVQIPLVGVSDCRA